MVGVRPVRTTRPVERHAWVRLPKRRSRAWETNMFANSDFAHEQVVHVHDESSGLKAIIAIHDTTLGPALGGCRMWPYGTSELALQDALRLSKGMTYKATLAGLPLGGGKCVVLGDPYRDKTPALMHALGREIDRLGGRYVAAEDSGTSVQDLKLVAERTNHVVGIARGPGFDGKVRDGDPSPATAYGCYVGIRAAVRHRYGSDTLAGVRVAIQGVGNVGRELAALLDRAGVELVVSDINSDQLRFAVERFGAKAVRPDRILSADVDVLAPCAMGGVLDAETVATVRADIVAGSANNQLLCPEHGDMLAERGILYVPDYAINSGGIIDVAAEHRGYDPRRVRSEIESIATTVSTILDRSKASSRAPHRVADRLVEEQLERARARSEAPHHQRPWIHEAA